MPPLSTWVSGLPFALYATRALLVLALAGVPRRHPQRDLLLTAVVLAAIASDLLDGAIARALRMTGWESVYWCDHAADLVFFFGAVAVIGGRKSFAKDAPSLGRVAEGPGRLRLAGWIALIIALVAEIYVLLFERMFGQM